MILEICPICEGDQWGQPEGQTTWVCKNCKPEKFSQPATAAQSPEKICDRCNGKNFWLPKNSQQWRCESCSPPPSEIFVANRIGMARDARAKSAAAVAPPASSEVVRIDQWVVTYCMPWCERCGSWQGVESLFSDDTVETVCRVCRAAMPERPIVKPVEAIS